MTEKELTAIEARATAATREPWSVSGTFVPSASLSAVSVYGMGMEVAECQMDADGAFIAAARVDVPALVAEVRKLRAERDALRMVDDAMVERAAKAFYEQGKRFAWADVSTLSRSMFIAGARASLDAAMIGIKP